jgi:hypothetical protein
MGGPVFVGSVSGFLIVTAQVTSSMKIRTAHILTSILSKYVFMENSFPLNNKGSASKDSFFFHYIMFQKVQQKKGKPDAKGAMHEMSFLPAFVL